MSTIDNNKRIAKNTLLLYVRMLLTMAVSLFTVRIVLNTLGVVDYGILNVVGGIVMMFSFISNTMMTATQRFFSYDIGQNNIEQLRKTFSTSLTIYLIIAVVILILSETIGLWFLNNKMIIPIERLSAANWIYQFSIFSFIVTILTIPYNAAIISHEDMNIYAFMSILEVTLKLIIVFILIYFSFDKLKLYSVLLFLVTISVSYIYKYISKKKYSECKFSFSWDKELFKKLLSFSGWTLFGAIASVLNNQGINIVLNLFFGPVVNAARAIAYQINTNVNQLVMNFFTAVNPQIIKYYATENKKQMMTLVFQSSKFSFFLLYIISMPFLIETHYILDIWLKSVPEYIVIFTRLILINALIDSVSYSLQSAAQANGNIRLYQIVVGGMLLLNLPISYYVLENGGLPQTTIYISIIISLICLALRLIMLRKLVELPVRIFFSKVILVILPVSILSAIVPILLYFKFDDSFMRFSLVVSTSIALTLLFIYFVGISKEERNQLNSYVQEKFKHKKN